MQKKINVLETPGGTAKVRYPAFSFDDLQLFNDISDNQNNKHGANLFGNQILYLQKLWTQEVDPGGRMI
jgi:hypothetical protein